MFEKCIQEICKRGNLNPESELITRTLVLYKVASERADLLRQIEDLIERARKD